MATKKLVYVLVNYRTLSYLKMFAIFLKSVVTWSNTKDLDLLIICDEASDEVLTDADHVFQSQLLPHFANVFHHTVPTDESLRMALLRKLDIAAFDTSAYDVVMYMDVDMIAQGDVSELMEDLYDDGAMARDALYATPEGDFDGEYWSLPSVCTPSHVMKFRLLGLQSFNTGLFAFRPSQKMNDQFRKVRAMAVETYAKQDVKSFYDQSFFNCHFSMDSVSSPALSVMTKNFMFNSVYRMFPVDDQLYMDKTIIHFAGIGDYDKKSERMQKYLNDVMFLKPAGRI